MQDLQLYFSWGLRPDPSLEMPLKVVRADKSNAEYHPYNSFTVRFSLKEDTPDDIELRVIVDIRAENQAVLLQGSITENFPAVNAKQVTCQE